MNKNTLQKNLDLDTVEENLVLTTDESAAYATNATTNATYSGVYKLKNKASGLLVTVDSGSTSSATVTQNSDWVSRSQWFRITHLGGEQYSIRPLHKTDMALTAVQVQNTTYVVSAINVGYCDTLSTLDAASRWTIESNGTIRNVLYDCLVMTSEGMTSGSYIYALDDNSSTYQRWILERCCSIAPKFYLYDTPANAYIGTTVSAGTTEVSTEYPVTQNVTWSSSNTAVATINSRSGVITPKAMGKTSIIATPQYNTSLKESYTLTVREADADNDGIPDAQDPLPNNNTFTGTLRTASSNATPSFSYTIDFTDFTANTTYYNSDLCVMSAIASALMYSGSTFDGDTIDAWMQKHHMLGCQTNNSYKHTINGSDDHLSEVALGFIPIANATGRSIVVAVIIRGTNTTLAEWSSNVDVGDTRKFSEYSEWTNSDHHMGFDITSNRIITAVNKFVNDYITSKSQYNGYGLTYWVTGHSRGGALANLVAAKLLDANKRVMSYTFATPATTISSTAHNAKYNSIFNIVNEDDFIAYFPLEDWNFTRYGKTAKISVEDKYEVAWRTLTGITDYSSNKEGVIDLYKNFGEKVTSRRSCYNYESEFSSLREIHAVCLERVQLFPSVCNGYYKVEELEELGEFEEIKYQPMFFMKALADYMASDKNLWDYLEMINAGVNFGYIFTELVSINGQIQHPHYPVTYYLLSTKVNSTDFKN